MNRALMLVCIALTGCLTAERLSDFVERRNREPPPPVERPPPEPKSDLATWEGQCSALDKLYGRYDQRTAGCLALAQRDHADAETMKVAVPNPAAVRAGGSAILCLFEAARESTLSQIVRERSYSQISGVQNNVLLYAWQEQLRQIDYWSAANRQALDAMPATPLACTDPTVRVRMACAFVAVDPNGRGNRIVLAVHPECGDPRLAQFRWMLRASQ